MARGFFKGLITGSILGIVLGSSSLMAPHKKKLVAKRIKGKSKVIQSQANKVLKEMRSGVSDLLRSR